MNREWVLIIGDVGVPELASALPEIFENLIRNLRSCKDKKFIACTGNLGTSGPSFVRFLKSLVSDGDSNVFLLKGYLPSNLTDDNLEGVVEKESCIFEAAGVSIGMISPYHLRCLKYPHFPSQLRVSCPSVATILGAHCDFVICCDCPVPSVTQNIDGTTFLCPGSATGVHIFVEDEFPVPVKQLVPIVEIADDKESRDDHYPLSPSPQIVIEDAVEEAQKHSASSPLNLLDDDGGVDDGFFSTQSRTNQSSPHKAPAVVSTAEISLPNVSDSASGSHTGDTSAKAADINTTTNSADIDSTTNTCASFMLLSITNAEITLFTYKLIDGELRVNQTSLDHPFPSVNVTG
eukprot:Gregarina_sp_Poly_1__6226@NODE_32_length_19284_cov_132_623615_g29_i0_p6_GENE_NODE_32_length_19284_cov_132_623615_g29_i0NODE_32_length_19284_cov_132_623615_g29_i0_p6_ORF_typecomplete_len348_score47_20_NODE_32_length_19284_cov_132_623615_g29_i064117454